MMVAYGGARTYSLDSGAVLTSCRVLLSVRRIKTSQPHLLASTLGHGKDSTLSWVLSESTTVASSGRSFYGEPIACCVVLVGAGTQRLASRAVPPSAAKRREDGLCGEVT